MGNLARARALQIVADSQSLVSFSDRIPGSMRIRSIPTRRTVFQLPVPNPQSSNYASCVYWQLPLDASDAGRLFAQCVEESLFDQLRTKRQMGYIVWSLFSDMAGSAGFLVIVQSNSVGEGRCGDV